MKTLLLLLAAAGLAGCATYRVPDYASGANPAYAQHPAHFIYDSAGYPFGYRTAPYFYPSTYPYIVPRPFVGRPRLRHGAPARPGKGSALANAVRPPHGNNQ
jgi:hypothetical protein